METDIDRCFLAMMAGWLVGVDTENAGMAKTKLESKHLMTERKK